MMKKYYSWNSFEKECELDIKAKNFFMVARQISLFLFVFGVVIKAHLYKFCQMSFYQKGKDFQRR